jgi:hypothetical protein
MIVSSGKALPATFVHYLRMFRFPGSVVGSERLQQSVANGRDRRGCVKSLQRKALYRRSQGRAEIAQFVVDLAGSTHGFSYLFA